MFAVNGRLWKVRFVPAWSEFLMRSNKTFTVGMTDATTDTIYISDGLSNAFLEKVLAHELVHALSFSYKYKFDIETEEIIANFVAEHGREIIYLLDDLLAAIKGQAA